MAGLFGAIDPGRLSLDLSGPLPCLGKAGSVTVHHVRAVHGSATNSRGRSAASCSTRYRAADALAAPGLQGRHRQVQRAAARRRPTIEPRLMPVPVRLPLPPAEHQGSIYENQTRQRPALFPYRRKRRAAAAE